MSKLKKVVIGLSVLLFLIVGALLVIPFVYDVNKLKPQITQAIEQNLNVKAEIGNLSLNLLWGINVGIETLKITENVSKNVLFELKNATLRVPYMSALTGNLSITLLSDKPQINVIKFKDGTLNVAKLMKTPANKADVDSTQPEGTKQEGPGAAAAFGASRVSFSTDITEAKISFKDLQSGFDYKIDNLNVKLDDVGINREFSYNVSTDLSVDNKKDLVLKGKALVDGDAKIEIGGSGFEAISLNAHVDMTGLEAKMAGLLNKTKEIPFKIDASLRATTENANIEKIELIAGDFRVLAQGKIENFSSPIMDLSVSSSDMDLKNWKEIIAPLKAFDMLGKLSLNLKVQGSAANPQMNGKFEFHGGSLKVAALKERVSDINMTAIFDGNKMTFQNTGLKIGASDMKLSGYVENFAAPKVDLDLTSSLLDLDKMLPTPPKEDAKGTSKEESEKTAAAGTKNEDPFAGMRNNPTMQKLDLVVNAKAAKVIVKGVTITDLKADVLMKNLVLTIKNAALKVFSGSADAFLQLDINQKLPSYQMTANLKNVDINQAVVSQAKSMDKYITGFANGNLVINGTGTEMVHLKKNLKGSGKFFVKDGTWLAADAFKNIGEKLAKVPKVGEKLSGIKITDKFKELKADFTIQSGELNIQNAIVDMKESNAAVDISGVIDFDQNMKMAGNILAPIKDVPKDLKAADGRGKIPFELSGKATKPELEWEKTFRKVAAAYAKDEGKKLIKQGAESLIKDKNVKKLFEKFKF